MRAVAAVFLLTLGCGQGQRCFDNAPCEVGLRCDLEQNLCVTCGEIEIPYNGIDDDCDARSDDRDVDGDDDDADRYRQGGDCDDADPTVSSLVPEVCGDNRDNDCDGDIDEVDCGDRVGPMVRFVSPKGGDGLYGAGVPIVIDTEDDVGVTQVRLFANQIQIGLVDVEPRPSRTTTFRIDARTLPEGAMTLRVEATDVAQRFGSDQVQVQIDNDSSPEATFTSPELINAYAGDVSVVVDARDFAGVASVDLRVDGQLQGLVEEQPFSWVVDSLPLDEGRHELEAKVTDVTGLFATTAHSFTVDRTPPMVSVLSPIAGTVVRGTFEVEVDARDASGISAIGIAERWVSGGSQTIAVDSTQWDNGGYLLEVRARDRVIRNGAADQGNEASATLMLVVDNPADPIVTLVEPTSVVDAFYELRVQAEVRSPLRAQIAHVDVWIDGTRRGRVSELPYVLQVPLGNASGPTVVEVRAVDVEGREGRASQIVNVVPAPDWRVAQRSPSAYELSPGVVADFAGKPSLLVPGRPSRLWQADASGVFVHTQSFSDADLVYSGDVDADGVSDLVFTSAGDLELWRGQAGGTYVVTPQPRLPASVIHWAFGDFDGDSDLDLYFSTAQGHWSLQWEGLRWSSLTPIGGAPASVAEVIDYNLDLRQDLVVGGPQGALEVWSLNGVWQRQGGLVLPGGVQAIGVADAQNLLVGHQQLLTRLRLSAQTALGFEVVAQRSTRQPPQSVHFMSATGNPQWWVHDGFQLQALESETLVPLRGWLLPGEGALVADFDGDLLVDASSIQGGDLLLALGRAGASLNAAEVLEVEGQPRAVAPDPGSAGRIAVLSQARTPRLRVFDSVNWDFDLVDGTASDLVWMSAGLIATNGQRMFWVSDSATVQPLLNSTADLVAAQNDTLALGLPSRAPSDFGTWSSALDPNPLRTPLFSIDQAEDFVWSPTAGVCVINAGNPVLWCQVDAAPVQTAVPRGSHAISFLNHDGDGIDDAVLAHDIGLSIYRGVVGGGFVLISNVVTGAAVDSVFASDINGDGLADLLFTSGDRLWVAAAKANGSWFNPVDYDLGAVLRGAMTSDLDASGTQDLITWGQSQAVLRATAR